MSATTSPQIVSSNPTLWMGNIDTSFMNEDFIKDAFARSGFPEICKVQIKARESQGKSAPLSCAFVTFNSEAEAQKAMDALNDKPIPNCGDSKRLFKLNFKEKKSPSHHNSQGGFNSYSSRSGNLSHDAGRHSASRSSPAWHSNSGKPNSVMSHSGTTQFVNKSYGQSQQLSAPHPLSQQQQPQHQHQQQELPQQQPPKQTNHQQQAPFSRASSRSFAGRQPPPRNQQPDYTIFVGSLDHQVASENLQETFKSIYPSVSSAKVIFRDGESKQFGFVHFQSSQEFHDALNLQSETAWAKLKANLGKDTRISKAHPQIPKGERRRPSSHSFSGNQSGPPIANGSGNIAAPPPLPSDSNSQDINSNSNLPNSSPSSLSNLSNSSNNNPTPRPSSNSASPAKPAVQHLIPLPVHPYAYPHQLYYYPNAQFAGPEAFTNAAGQISHLYQPAANFEGAPLYWPSHYPVADTFVPRGPVHTAHPSNPGAGDVIHPHFGHPHPGQSWPSYIHPTHFHTTLVPSDNSELPPNDQMPSFDGSRA